MQEARSQNATDEDVMGFRFSKDQVGKIRFEGAEALYRIKLRLNKNEAEQNKLNKLLDVATNTQNQINIEKGIDYSEAINAIERASSCSQGILKGEWERVKRGEQSFRVTKNWVMPIIMAISLAFISILLFNSDETNKSMQPTTKASAD